MQRIRIVHETQYHYHQPVKFGAHRALLRPREGHDLHISRSRLSVAPAAAVRWLRDIYGNSIAVLTFEERSQRLCVASEVDVELYDDNPIECLIEPAARQFPFQYLPEEQVELMVYRLPSYPYDGPQLQNWLHELYRPGQVIGTFDLLHKLNTHIHQSFKYARREEPGVQLPHETLTLGSGSCRDRGAHDGRRAALGVRGEIRHRLHPDGRRSARRYARLDRNLHSGRGLARF
jgi:transglutaminase-like putative cysteine protease